VALLRAVESGKLPGARLDEAVLRILDAKRNYGLIG
jgi:beta-glucosidase-like glycosyl hydrolase